MPLNRFSPDFPEPIWLMDPTRMPISHRLHGDPSTAAASASRRLPREPMFEKPLTPSDVGKLNRLVIPKQKAEKYFPLGAGESGEKDLLLSFEDESGKCWRFRYSYWNSSQSYVLTKGWSRYVKEKRLDAGDVVLFERHAEDSDRMFIGWRRGTATNLLPVGGGRGGATGFGNAGGLRWGVGVCYNAPGGCYPAHPPLGRPERLKAPAICSVTRSQSPPSCRTLRLFGVNLECHLEKPSSSDHQQSSGGSPMSSTSSLQYNNYFDHHHGNNMGINLHTENRPG